MSATPSFAINSALLVESFSGIRGCYGEGLTDAVAYAYAWAYCQLFCDPVSATPLVIAGDTRPSTPALKQAIIRAWKAYGIKNVIDLGVVPVQTAEHAVLRFKARGGVYITGSHNEPHYNGLKFLQKDGAILSAEQSTRLIAAAHAFDRERPTPPTGGTKPAKKVRRSVLKIRRRHNEAVQAYVNYIIQRLGKRSLAAIKARRFHLLADPNGGAASVILVPLLAKLGVRATIINRRPGVFKRLVEPNHESLQYLEPLLTKRPYAFGCGFDADADRIELILPASTGFARAMGSAVSGNYVLALACNAVLAGTSNEVVPVNDCTSYLVRDVIRPYKARVAEVEVGETNVVSAIEHHKSRIGGEGSNGGVIIPPINCRDGIMTLVLILKLLAENEYPDLAAALADYPRYYEERAKFVCRPEQVASIKHQLERHYSKKGYRIKKTGDETGGLKILIDHSTFIWFRPSKTENGAFRIIANGNDQPRVAELLAEGVVLFKKFK